MSHPILSRVPFLEPFVDERFLEHRRRSSSFAGIVAADAWPWCSSSTDSSGATYGTGIWSRSS